MLYKTFKTPTGGDKILAWKSKGMSAESIKPPDISGKSCSKINFYL